MYGEYGAVPGKHISKELRCCKKEGANLHSKLKTENSNDPTLSVIRTEKLQPKTKREWRKSEDEGAREKRRTSLRDQRYGRRGQARNAQENKTELKNNCTYIGRMLIERKYKDGAKEGGTVRHTKEGGESNTTQSNEARKQHHPDKDQRRRESRCSVVVLCCCCPVAALVAPWKTLYCCRWRFRFFCSGRLYLGFLGWFSCAFVFLCRFTVRVKV